MDNHQKQPKLLRHSKNAFVLGNGRSRMRLNLPELKKYGKVYGCNALYREFEPDYLVAVDEKMVKEIEKTGWQLRHEVWTNPNKNVLKIPGMRFFNPHKGWSSGPTALWLASTHGYDNIFIFGFDYQGVNGKVNNVYADTQNYKRSIEPATYFGNWVNQTEKVIREFKNTRFHRIIERDTLVPPTIGNITTNLQHNFFEEFEIEFPGTIFK
jgi:hypothetical protein